MTRARFNSQRTRPTQACTTDLDEVPKDVLDLIGVLDNGYYLHRRTTLWADERIYLVDLDQQPGPCTLAGGRVDLLGVCRRGESQRCLIAIRAAVVLGSPPVRSTFCDVIHPFSWSPPVSGAGFPGSGVLPGFAPVRPCCGSCTAVKPGNDREKPTILMVSPTVFWLDRRLFGLTRSDRATLQHSGGPPT